MNPVLDQPGQHSETPSQDKTKQKRQGQDPSPSAPSTGCLVLLWPAAKEYGQSQVPLRDGQGLLPSAQTFPYHPAPSGFPLPGSLDPGRQPGSECQNHLPKATHVVVHRTVCPGGSCLIPREASEKMEDFVKGSVPLSTGQKWGSQVAGHPVSKKATPADQMARLPAKGHK